MGEEAPATCEEPSTGSTAPQEGHLLQFSPISIGRLARQSSFAPGSRSRGHPNFLFRVAVREVEAWLLAHREGIARFLGISEHLVPLMPTAFPTQRGH